MKINKEIEEKVDILSYISNYVDLVKSGSNYKGLSPFKEEKTPSFVVSPAKKIFKDFSTGIGGNVIKFCMYIKNISYNEAIIDICKEYNIDSNYVTYKTNPYDKYYNQLSSLSEYYKKNLLNSKEAMSYLEKRGYDYNDVNEFNLGYADNSWNDLSENFDEKIFFELGLINKSDKSNYNFFRNRIIFPIYNIKNKIVGFGGRNITDDSNIAKYLNSKESNIFKKNNELYGIFDYGKKIKELGSVILVEGFFDVIRLHKNNIRNTVASLGTSLTENHAKKISKLTTNIVLAYDDDEAGNNAKIRTIYLLNKYGFNIKIMSLDGKAKDPDEFIQKYGREAFVEQIKKSKDSFEYLYDIYTSSYNMSKQGSKIEVIKKFSEYFSTMNNQLFLEEKIKLFANKLNISENALVNNLKFNKEKIKNNNLTNLKDDEIKNKNNRTYKLTLEDFTMILLYYSRNSISLFNDFNFSEENKDIFDKLLDTNFDESNLDKYSKMKLFENKLAVDKNIIDNEFKKNIYVSWVKKYISNSLEEILILKYNGDLNLMDSETYLEYIKYKLSLKKISNYKINEVIEEFNNYLEFERK